MNNEKFDVECVQCEWKGTVDETLMDVETGDMQCPVCGQPVELLNLGD